MIDFQAVSAPESNADNGSPSDPGFVVCGQDPGPRESMEDRVYAQSWRDVRGAFIHALALFDGAGGHAFGELAGALGILVSGDGFPWPAVARYGSEGRESLLVQLLHRANHAVCAAAQSLDRIDDMASTAVLALLDAERVTVAWAGDSRAILVAPETVECLTQDHEDDEGRLTQYLGRSQRFKPGVVSRELRPGEAIALVSDGITDVLSADQIAAIVRAHGEWSAEALVQAAVEAGTGDNASAVVWLPYIHEEAGHDEQAAQSR